MKIERSWNPSLGTDTFLKAEAGDGEMTLEWTIRKSFLLVGLTILSALWVWNYAELFMPFFYIFIVVTLVIAFIIIFKNKTAPYLAPVYAILEWLFIGTISYFFETQFPGIVLQWVSLTFWVFLSLLLAYQSGLIKATENFKLWIVAATWGIFIIYMISLVWNMFGWYSVPFIHEWGIVWILFSIFVVVIASLNLVLDFDFIEAWVEARAPKYMEWYASFGLLVTLVWLYLEVLRLLAKLRE